MSQLSPVLRDAEGNRLHFWCPGCDEMHGINVGEGPGPHWNWNGNAEKPTFTPSILCTGRRFTEEGEKNYLTWYDAGMPKPMPTFEAADFICHSYVTDGRIQFLGDCTHKLANQTVDLPHWSE